MLRSLFRLILVLLVFVLVGAFFLGYRRGRPMPGVTESSPGVTGTAGTTNGIDEARARRAGAEVGGKVAAGVNEAERVVADAGLTAKIKSKMALDDMVRARHVDVDTVDSVVTLTGVVGSEAERARALQLARETAGVTSVTDRLEIGGSAAP